MPQHDAQKDQEAYEFFTNAPPVNSLVAKNPTKRPIASKIMRDMTHR